MPDYRITGGDDLVEYYVFDADTADDALEAWARDSGYETFEAMCDDGMVDSDAVEVEPLSEVDDTSIPDDVRQRRDELEQIWQENPDLEQVPATQQKAEADLKEQGYTLERAEPLEEDPRRRVTYWAQETGSGAVKQVHPNGDVRTYTWEEWEHIQETHLDE
jgi:hypothetical protein